jgi:anaerobic magnesium-protoporphyrin IX monomethyl ester cyclase
MCGLNLRVAFAVPNTSFGCFSPPLNLALLAACVRQTFPNYDIKIFDGSTDQSVEEEIILFQPHIVAVTATTPEAPAAYDLLDIIKQKKPDIFRVIGGVHASALPEEAAIHADTVVVGDGEIAIVEIINNLSLGKPIPRILQGQTITNLDSLPHPAYDLLKMNAYLQIKINYIPQLNRFPMARLIFSRGCNYRCPFCYNSRRRTPLRFNSADYIIQEIKYFVDTHGVRSVWFHDDDFLFNKKRLDEFIFKLKNSELKNKIIWACCARATSVNTEVAQQIKDAGCVCLFLGIESASPRSLKYLKCGTVKREDVEKALKICHNIGLPVYGNFIFGSPNETIKEMWETLHWINKHRRKGLTGVGFGILTPYPGTVTWDNTPSTKIFSQHNEEYARLIPTTNPYSAYTVDEAVTLEDFSRFLYYAERLVWLGNQAALGNTRSFFTKTFVWAALTHPYDIFRMITGK